MHLDKRNHVEAKPPPFVDNSIFRESMKNLSQTVKE